MTTIRKAYFDWGDRQVHARAVAAHDGESKPALLCFHPAPSSGLYFTTAMPLLNDGRRVIAPDYPGYGGSDSCGSAPGISDYASAMLAVATETSPDEAVDVLGFHTGCLVAVEMALQSPNAVRRLVLCDVPYFTGDAQRTLRKKMSTPLAVTPELDSLAQPWQFNVASRIGDVPLARALALLAEHLRAGSNDALGFSAAFSYDCESAFAKCEANTTVLATRSGLHAASLEAAAALPNTTLVDVDEVTSAVFEAGAIAISNRINAALDSI